MGTRTTSWWQIFGLIFTAQNSRQLNDFFTLIFVNGMLEGKISSFIDTRFLFIAAFIDRDTGYLDEAKLTTIHTIYFGLINYPDFKPPNLICSNMSYYSLDANKQKLNAVAQEKLGNFGHTKLFILKFHVLNFDWTKICVKGLSWCSSLQTFQVLIRTFMRTPSIGKAVLLRRNWKRWTALLLTMPLKG